VPVRDAAHHRLVDVLLLMLMLRRVAPVLGRVHGHLPTWRMVPAIGDKDRLAAARVDQLGVHRPHGKWCFLTHRQKGACSMHCAFDFGCPLHVSWIADYTSAPSHRRGRLLWEEKRVDIFASQASSSFLFLFAVRH